MRYCCFIFISLYFIVACEDKTTKETDHPTPPPFPNKVGTSWIYSITYSSSEVVDTLWVEITDVVTLNHRQASVWSYDIAHKETFVQNNIILADTVFMFSSVTEPELIKQFVFPLSIGSNWHSYNNKDSTHVVARNNITVPAGIYNKAYNLQRSTDSENNMILEEDFWFVADIGMVKNTMMLVGADIIPVSTTWELLEYNRPPWDGEDN